MMPFYGRNTMGAHMRTNTEGLVDILFTPRTLLRGVMRRYCNHLSVSTFSLALQELPEHPPECIGNGKGQTMVAHHVGRFQVLYDQRLVAIDIATRRLVQRIFALVGDALVNAGDHLFGLVAPMAALLALRQFALRACQFLGALLGVSGILNDLSIAIGNQIPDTQIQSDGVVLLGEWMWLGLTDALHIPAGGT